MSIDLEQLHGDVLKRLGADGHLEVLTSQSFRRATRRGEPLGDLKAVKVVWSRSYQSGATTARQTKRVDTLTEGLMSVSLWLDEDDKRLAGPVAPVALPPVAPGPSPEKPRMSLASLVSRKKK